MSLVSEIIAFREERKGRFVSTTHDVDWPTLKENYCEIKNEWPEFTIEVFMNKIELTIPR